MEQLNIYIYKKYILEISLHSTFSISSSMALSFSHSMYVPFLENIFRPVEKAQKKKFIYFLVTSMKSRDKKIHEK